MTSIMTKERGVKGTSFPCYNGEASADLLLGQPVMRRYSLDYVGAVMRPAGAGGLGEFAGVLSSKLAQAHLGDIASARMVGHGDVRATVYVHATPANYIVGAQLAPFYDATNGSYFKEVSYQTGITLLSDFTGKTAATLYSEATGLGAYIEISPQANCQNGALHYAWPGVLGADADYYKAATATSAGATTEVLAAGMLNSATPDFARNVTVTPGGTTADVAAGDIVVVGTDIYGAALTESISIAANASSAVSGTKAFATLTSVTFPIQDGAGATYTIGTGPLLGLARPFGVSPCVLQSKAAGTIESTVPTVAVDSDSISGNTISFDTAPAAQLLETWILPN